MGRTRFLLEWVAALLIAALLLVSAPAAAQTITNVATARWNTGGNEHTVASNTVSFSLARSPLSIETFVPSASASQSLSLLPSLCGGNTIVVPGVQGSEVPVASLDRTTTIHLGEILYFRLTYAEGNRNPAAIDSLAVVVTSRSGDREQLEVYETAPNSGSFIGAIRTSAIPPQPVQGDCRLSISTGDEIAVEAMAAGSGIIAHADVEVLADPFGLVFDSEDGTPVSRLRVSMVDALTG